MRLSSFILSIIVLQSVNFEKYQWQIAIFLTYGTKQDILIYWVIKIMIYCCYSLFKIIYHFFYVNYTSFVIVNTFFFVCLLNLFHHNLFNSDNSVIFISCIPIINLVLFTLLFELSLNIKKFQRSHITTNVDV